MKIDKKLIVVMLAITIVPIALLGYIALTDARELGYSSADESAIALEEQARDNVERITYDKAEEINDFFINVERNLRGVAKNMHTYHENPALWNNKYEGELLAHFGTNAWPEHVDKERVEGILEGTIEDENYDFIISVLDDEEEERFHTLLEYLAEGYTPLTTANQPVDSPEHHPRFMIEEDPDIFWDIDEIGDKIEDTENSFAMVNFMLSLLDEKAQEEIRKGMNVLQVGTPTVDSHPEYENLRMAYFGGERTDFNFELVYPGETVAYHPATQGIGNSYHCVSAYTVRHAGEARASWVNQLLDPDNRVSTAIYPVYKSFDNPASEKIGFVEYWINWQTLADEVVDITIEDTGYMLMIDEEGTIISHPDEEMLEQELAADGNTEMEEAVEEMKQGREGSKRMEYDGGEVYFIYAPVEQTGWSVASVVPLEEVVAPAEEIRETISEKTEGLGTQNTILWMTIIFIIIVVGISYALGTAISSPLIKLRNAADKVTSGNFDTELPKVRTKDEVAELIGSMSMLIQGFKLKQEQLEKKEKELFELKKEKSNEETQQKEQGSTESEEEKNQQQESENKESTYESKREG